MKVKVGELCVWDIFVILGGHDAHSPFLVIEREKTRRVRLRLLGSNGKMGWYDYASIKCLIHPLVTLNSTKRINESRDWP